MEGIIKIETVGDVRMVSARELHGFLGVQTRFNDWIERRIEEYEFVENQDYTCLTQKRVTQTTQGRKGAAVQKEYHLTLSMAKELAMLENNDKGKAARRYFIACEKEDTLC
jgi:phage anti-repressor protein